MSEPNDQRDNGPASPSPEVKETQRVHAQKAGSKHETRKSKAKPMGTALEEYFETCSKEAATIPSIDAAFRRLATIAAKQQQLDVAAIATWPTGGVSGIDASSLAIELCLAAEVLEASGGASLEWGRSVGATNLHIQLAKAYRISSSSLEKESLAHAQRRKWLNPTPDESWDSERLLRCSASGVWRPPAAAETDQDTDSSPSNRLEVLNTRLPLGREIATREELLTLARLDRSALTKTIEQQRLGLKCLERLVVRVGKAVPDNEVLEPIEREAITNVLLCIGRKPDIWARMGQQIAQLIGVLKEDTVSDLVTLWATTVAATWHSTTVTEGALELVSDQGLAAICRPAIDNSRGGLLGTVERLLSLRALLPSAQGSIWPALHKLQMELPHTRSWIAPLREQSERTFARTKAYSFAETADSSILLSDTLVEALLSEPADEAIPALALAFQRRRKEKYLTQEAERARALSRVKATSAALDRFQGAIVESYGGPAGDIAEAISDTQEAISSAFESLRQITLPTASNDTRSKRFTRIERPDAALVSLQYDPDRSASDAHQLRADVIGSLVELAQEDDSAVQWVPRMLPTLSPEAVSAVWEAGILSRSRTLLSTVSEIQERHDWATTLWHRLLLLHSGESARPIPIPIAAAEVAAANLGRSLSELISSHEFATSVANVVQKVEAATALLNARYLQGQTKPLAHLADLNARMTDGTQARN